MEDPFTVAVRPLLRASKITGANREQVAASFLAAWKGEFGPEETKHIAAQIGFTKLLEKEGGCANAKEAATLYGGKKPSSDEAVRKAARNGQVISIRDGRGGVHFPRWQFTEKGGVLAGLRDVISRLRQHPHFEDLQLVTFMLNPTARLGGKRPLDILRSKDPEGLKLVLRIAAESVE